MILERRAYTLRPGLAREFWALQHSWNTMDTIPAYLERNVGYFEVAGGEAEQIVHLQRYDDFADWRDRVASNQRQPGRQDYYSTARKLLTAQENGFYSPSPVARLSPLWNAERDWLCDRPVFPDAGDVEGLIVTETSIDLLPGTAPSYWHGLERFSQSDGFEKQNLVGMFVSLVGRLHRVLEYRWFASLDDFHQHRARLDGNEAWRAVRDGLNAHVTASRITILRPSPVPWMRALFTPRHGHSG